MLFETTVEPWFKEPLFNEVLDITNDILSPGQNYSKMYGIEPRYNETRYNEHIPEAQTQNLPRYNEMKCQHARKDKRWTDQQSTNLLILMVKRATFPSTAYINVTDTGT